MSLFIELPSCEEGVILVKQLNRFLDNSQLASLFENRTANDIEELQVPEKTTPETVPEPDYLEDPQLAAAMREGTKVVHRAAETSVFTR